MECSKRNRNIRHAIFKDSNLNRISTILLNRMQHFAVLLWQIQQTKKAFPNFGPIIIYIFGRFVKTKCRTFLRIVPLTVSREASQLLTAEFNNALKTFTEIPQRCFNYTHKIPSYKTLVLLTKDNQKHGSSRHLLNPTYGDVSCCNTPSQISNKVLNTSLIVYKYCNCTYFVVYLSIILFLKSQLTQC